MLVWARMCTRARHMMHLFDFLHSCWHVGRLDLCASRFSFVLGALFFSCLFRLLIRVLCPLILLEFFFIITLTSNEIFFCFFLSRHLSLSRSLSLSFTNYWRTRAHSVGLRIRRRRR